LPLELKEKTAVPREGGRRAEERGAEMCAPA